MSGRISGMASYLMYSIARLQRVVGRLLPYAPVTHGLFASHAISIANMKNNTHLEKPDMVPATFINFRD